MMVLAVLCIETGRWIGGKSKSFCSSTCDGKLYVELADMVASCQLSGTRPSNSSWMSDKGEWPLGALASKAT